jgi:AcrR family transcriptional regulator
VTISDITDHAGLTRRTFFRHFPDKREVLFVGSARISVNIEAAMARQPQDASARDAAIASLTELGHFLLRDPTAQARRQELIDTSVELQERERTKLASIARAIAQGLEVRGIVAISAHTLAAIGVEIFHAAYLRSVRELNESIFETEMEATRLSVERFLVE